MCVCVCVCVRERERPRERERERERDVGEWVKKVEKKKDYTLSQIDIYIPIGILSAEFIYNYIKTSS